MALYALCEITEPHIVRAYIKNDGNSSLPDGYLCVPAPDNNSEQIGKAWNGSAFVEYVPPPPNSVSAAQAKLALYNAGLLPDVEAAAAVYPPMQIFYANANEWHRVHPYVQGLAAELGLTDAQVDDLFRAAALL